MDPITLLPFIVLIGVMFLMTRSAKKKQRQAMQMRDQMQPGTGVRTIGGMYATVKEIRDDVVLLEVAPGVHALYGKNAIGAVLEPEEYARIANAEPQDDAGASAVVPDDASSLTSEKDDRIDLGKSAADEDEDENARPDKGKAEDGDSDSK